MLIKQFIAQQQGELTYKADLQILIRTIKSYFQNIYLHTIVAIVTKSVVNAFIMVHFIIFVPFDNSNATICQINPV